MNRIRTLLLLLALSGLFHFNARADNPVTFPTGPASWTITIADSPQRDQPLPAGVPKISRVDATQDGKFLRNLVSWSGGRSRDFWCIVGSDEFMVQETPTSVTLKHEGPYGFVPYMPSCFNWVQPSCLQEKDPVPYGNKQCFHYKGPMPYSPSLGFITRPGANQTVMGEAWIDSKTGLPVALDDGSYLATFVFSQDTPSPLKLPPGYKQLYEAIKG